MPRSTVVFCLSLLSCVSDTRDWRRIFLHPFVVPCAASLSAPFTIFLLVMSGQQLNLLSFRSFSCFHQGRILSLPPVYKDDSKPSLYFFLLQCEILRFFPLMCLSCVVYPFLLQPCSAVLSPVKENAFVGINFHSFSTVGCGQRMLLR